MKSYVLILQRKLWLARHQDKIIRSFSIGYKLVFQKLGSKERKDMFVTEAIFKLKGNILCFMFNIKKCLCGKVV